MGESREVVAEVVEAIYEEPGQEKPNLPAIPEPEDAGDPGVPADSFIMAAALQMMASNTPDKRVRKRCGELLQYFKGPSKT